jgi:hypothetical protein
MKQIIDCTTGEVTERELIENELTQQAIDETIVLSEKAEAEAKAQAKAALLERLGITADEAKLLLA